MSKTYHHGDLKSAVIRKTVDIIEKRGEANFTLREIAKSLKVSHTAVYRHFGSKHDLLSHIAEEGFNNLTTASLAALENTHNPRQRLTDLGRAYIEFALNHKGHYRCMFHQELRCAKEQRPDLETAGFKSFAVLVDAIQDGMRTQVFRKVDPLIAARSIWSGVHGFAVLLIDGQFQDVTSKASVRAAIDQHLGFLERGLLK